MVVIKCWAISYLIQVPPSVVYLASIYVTEIIKRKENWNPVKIQIWDFWNAMNRYSSSIGAECRWSVPIDTVWFSGWILRRHCVNSVHSTEVQQPTNREVLFQALFLASSIILGCTKSDGKLGMTILAPVTILDSIFSTTNSANESVFQPHLMQPSLPVWADRTGQWHRQPGPWWSQRGSPGPPTLAQYCTSELLPAVWKGRGILLVTFHSHFKEKPRCFYTDLTIGWELPSHVKGFLTRTSQSD